MNESEGAAPLVETVWSYFRSSRARRFRAAQSNAVSKQKADYGRPFPTDYFYPSLSRSLLHIFKYQNILIPIT